MPEPENTDPLADAREDFVLALESSPRRDGSRLHAISGITTVLDYIRDLEKRIAELEAK
jgi:hypothetical protein